MNTPRSSDITTVINVDIAPLQHSEYALGTDGNLIQAWSSNIPEQFPIDSIDQQDKRVVILHIGHPHKNYTIQTEMKKGKLNGKAIIKSPTNVVVGKIHYLNGEMTGKCKLYNESGVLFFKGFLHDGYRQGKGTEYDTNGKVLFDGLFVGGGREYRYHKVIDMEGYWAELEEDGSVRSICQIDNNLFKQGVCLFYDHSKIEQISEWKDNVVVNMIKRFKDGEMIEYKNGVKSYVGSYYAIGKTCFIRVSGREYDVNGENVVYDGDFIDGKRSGFGILYNSKGEVIYDGVWKYGIKSSVYICISYTLFMIVFFALLYLFIFIEFDIKGVGGLLFWALVLAIYMYTKLTEVEVIPVPFYYDENHTIKILYLCGREVVIESNLNEFTYFKIDGLRKMRKLTLPQMDYKFHSSSLQRFVRIYNCEELEEIVIGDKAFTYFDEFGLRNLPSLEKIRIGDIDHESRNFQNSNFVLRDLPSLKTVIIGGNSFVSNKKIVFDNLPKLKTIALGKNALEGEYLSQCKMEMINLPRLHSITSKGYSFLNVRSLVLKDIPNLQTVSLPNAFKKVSTVSISNVSSALEDLFRC